MRPALNVNECLSNSFKRLDTGNVISTSREDRQPCSTITTGIWGHSIETVRVPRVPSQSRWRKQKCHACDRRRSPEGVDIRHRIGFSNTFVPSVAGWEEQVLCSRAACGDIKINLNLSYSNTASVHENKKREEITNVELMERA